MHLILPDKAMDDPEFVLNQDIKGIFQLTFDYMDRTLGLGNHNEGLRLFIKSRPRKIRDDSGKVIGEEGGAVNARHRRPILLRATAQLPHELIATMCHEMVHVKDIVRGNLLATETQSFWKGREILADESDPVKDPAEYEPYHTMWINSARLYKSLPFSAREYVDEAFDAAREVCGWPETVLEFYKAEHHKMEKRMHGAIAI